MSEPTAENLPFVHDIKTLTARFIKPEFVAMFEENPHHKYVEEAKVLKKKFGWSSAHFADYNLNWLTAMAFTGVLKDFLTPQEIRLSVYRATSNEVRWYNKALEKKIAGIPQTSTGFGTECDLMTAKEIQGKVTELRDFQENLLQRVSPTPAPMKK